jgi:hypothetical protein
MTKQINRLRLFHLRKAGGTSLRDPTMAMARPGCHAVPLDRFADLTATPSRRTTGEVLDHRIVAR